MKRFMILIIVITAMLSGCAVNKSINFKDTNAYFLKENIAKLNLRPITEFINKEDKVVIVPIDESTTTDNYLIATFEDAILQKLNSEGFILLERDDDLIYRLISESNENYNHYRKHKSEATSNVGSYGSSSSIALAKGALLGSGSANISSSGQSAMYENYDPINIQSNLASADKIIAYRVLENGIIYESPDKESIDKTKRKARLVVSIRLEDAKTGEILKVEELTQISSDIIQNSNIRQLEKMHYSNYSFAYPNQYGNPSASYIKKSSSSSSFKGSNVWIVVGGTVAALALGLSIMANSD